MKIKLQQNDIRKIEIICPAMRRNHIQSDLYLAATLGTLKSGRLIEVGRLTEVQYKLDRKGSKNDFMASIK